MEIGVEFIVFVGLELFYGIIIIAENESSTLNQSGVLVLFLIYGLSYIWRVNKCLYTNRGDVRLHDAYHSLISLQFLSSNISVNTPSYRGTRSAARH